MVAISTLYDNFWQMSNIPTGLTDLSISFPPVNIDFIMMGSLIFIEADSKSITPEPQQTWQDKKALAPAKDN